MSSIIASTRQRLANLLKYREEAEEGEDEEGGGLPNPWDIYGEPDTLPGIDDEFMRFQVETANEEDLRSLFKNTVENAKDPAEKARLREMVNANRAGNGLKSHPILAKFKQFFSREISLLPNMDVEQQVKHNELQNRKQYLKELQQKNEKEMSPRP